MKRKYLPELSELIDRLGITYLKCIKLGCKNPEKKKAYVQELKLIKHDINLIVRKNIKNIKDWGQFIGAIQIGLLANETIWSNESEARKEGYNDGHKLLFTHSVNGMRMRAGNVIASQIGGKKDLNLDRVNDKISEERGYDWNGLFD